MVDFWGQVLHKWLSCLQDQQSGPPAFHDHHHLLVHISQYVWDGREALPIKPDIQDEVTVCRPVCRTHRRLPFDVAIRAHVGSEDVPIQLHQDATHGHFNSTGAFIFRLKPEVFCEDIAPGRRLWGQQDIPSSETSPAEVPAWDASRF